MRNKKFWTILFYLWIIGIYILTSMSFSTGTTVKAENGFRTDYIQHFILFAILPVLYFFSNGASLQKVIKDPYYIILLGVLFSILTEIQQAYIPDRSFNPVDLVLNLMGFISGIFMGKYLYRILIANNEQ